MERSNYHYQSGAHHEKTVGTEIHSRYTKDFLTIYALHSLLTPLGDTAHWLGVDSLVFALWCSSGRSKFRLGTCCLSRINKQVSRSLFTHY